MFEGTVGVDVVGTDTDDVGTTTAFDAGGMYVVCATGMAAPML